MKININMKLLRKYPLFLNLEKNLKYYYLFNIFFNTYARKNIFQKNFFESLI